MGRTLNLPEKACRRGKNQMNFFFHQADAPRLSFVKKINHCPNYYSQKFYQKKKKSEKNFFNLIIVIYKKDYYKYFTYFTI